MIQEETSRKLFEEWIESRREGCPVDRRPDGEYEFEPARQAWIVWRACWASEQAWIVQKACWASRQVKA